MKTVQKIVLDDPRYNDFFFVAREGNKIELVVDGKATTRKRARFGNSLGPRGNSESGKTNIRAFEKLGYVALRPRKIPSPYRYQELIKQFSEAVKND